MKRSLLANLAAFLTAAMGAMIAVPPERLAMKTPFGPCATEGGFTDIVMIPPPTLPNDDSRYDLSNPCFANL